MISITPIPLSRWAAGLTVALALTLTACGGGNQGSEGADAAAPAAPAASAPPATRAGTAYDVMVFSAANQENVGVSVFEPSTVVEGQTYPVIIHSHGWAGSRPKAADAASMKPFQDAGYLVVTFDQRGWGESGGTIRAMDPDFDGQNVLAVLDWVESTFSYLAYAPGPGGVKSSPKGNLVLGSFGGSYGGMFQLMLYHIDPKKRLDVMQVNIAPYSLSDSIWPSTVAKSVWTSGLLGVTANNGRVDPYMRDVFLDVFLTPEHADFINYHSHAYFCEGLKVATNGGPGTAPKLASGSNYPIQAVVSQSPRDTLFNFGQGVRNFECLSKLGGDVRFTSQQAGHFINPDAGNFVYAPVYPGNNPAPGNQSDPRCGSLNTTSADTLLAFFNEHLKGQKGAADVLSKKPCVSIASGDAVFVEKLLTPSSEGITRVAVPATNVVTGAAGSNPVAIDLGIVGGNATTVLAGIPAIDLQLSSPTPALPMPPVVYVGLGQSRNGVPGVWDLLNNQVTAVKGLGPQRLDLAGVAARLQPGERLALLVYGQHDQYAGANAQSAPGQLVSLQGAVVVPVQAGFTAAP